jgi:hypothetical protein
LKIQGRGYLMCFCQNPEVKGFRKNCLGGSPYFGFYCIFINKCFEICLRGILYLPSPSPYLNPLVCIYEFQPFWHCCMCRNPANGRVDFLLTNKIFVTKDKMKACELTRTKVPKKVTFELENSFQTHQTIQFK